MTTSVKLWLGFGTLTALLLLLGATISLRLRSIESHVKAQADVARPRSDAARELEIKVHDYTLSVLEYRHQGDSASRAKAAQDAAAVGREHAGYARLAMTDQQRELARRFDARWRQMHTLGQALLSADRAAASREDVSRFHDLRTGLERFLDEEMQVDAVAAYMASRNATLGDVRTIIGLTLLLVAIGSLIAAATSVVVGRGIVHAEQSLQQAHDELEGRVAERTAELVTSNEALKRSNRELEEFAAVASHDLQEPLRKIQAFCDRLMTRSGDGLGEQGRDHLGRILESAARMRVLIDDLLTLSRVTTQGQQFVPTRLTDVAHEAVSSLEARILETGGRVEVDELPVVDADPSQMRQLLQNLVANGLKFQRPDARPVVRVRGRLLPAAGSDEPGDGPPGDRCEITVEDDGIGFEETYLDRIFEVFQRLHGRDEYEGTGMGLAICRKIVERHGGQITARSTLGRGATFIVTLPVRQPEEDETR